MSDYRSAPGEREEHTVEFARRIESWREAVPIARAVKNQVRSEE